MKIALVADLHGNKEAVMALERDLQKRPVDALWCLGDLVGKGPDSDWTFDWAVQNCALILQGNWDEGIGKKLFPNDSFYYEQLGPKRMEALLHFPLEKRFTLSGRKIRLIHGRPVLNYLPHPHDEADSLLPLLLPDYDMLGYADCHRQGLRTLKGQIFNIGSVGNALGQPLVQYALLSGGHGELDPIDLSFVTLGYDRQKAIASALKKPQLPCGSAYIRELTDGVYAHHSFQSAQK